MSRQLHFVCPDCPAIETVILSDVGYLTGLAQDSSIECRCDLCETFHSGPKDVRQRTRIKKQDVSRDREPRNCGDSELVYYPTSI